MLEGKEVVDGWIWVLVVLFVFFFFFFSPGLFSLGLERAEGSG